LRGQRAGCCDGYACAQRNANQRAQRNSKHQVKRDANQQPAEIATSRPTQAPASSPTETPTSRPTETPTSRAIGTALITASGSFFALSVADLQASARWYSEKLGLKIVLQPPKTDQATVIVLEGDGLIVELVQQDAGVSLTQIAPNIKDKILVHGIVKAGAIIADFDQTVARLRRADRAGKR
jgi:predicted lactoylglutathione lyase